MSIEISDLVSPMDSAWFESSGWDARHSFVDFIKLSAAAEAGCPDVFGESSFVTPDDGRSPYQSFKSKRFEGEYGSQYYARCKNFRIEFDGNVGRFDRPDNLWNYRFDDTFAKAKLLLARNGLFGTDWRVNKLDLTANIWTGSPENAAAFLQQSRFLEIAHCSKEFPEYSGVAWDCKSKRLTLYDKGDLLLQKAEALEAECGSGASGVSVMVLCVLSCV
jgi:hypothetical protein